MKKFIIAFLATMAGLLSKGYSQTSDSTINALLAIDENQFIDKPLDSIISKLPSGYIRIKVYAGGHQYTARCLNVLYPNQVWIDLHVRDFSHINPRNDNKTWDITLMRKEKLYKTVIYKHTECFRNCDVR